MGRKPVQQCCQSLGRKPVLTADAGPLDQFDRTGKTVFGKHLVRDLEGFFKADRATEAIGPDFQKNLVGYIVVGTQQHGRQDFSQRPRLAMNINRF